VNQEHGQLTNWKPRFFTLWTGQTISLIGSRIVQFALVWWLTKLTGSAQLNAAGVWAREKDFDMTYVRSDTQRRESHGFYHQ